jgi:hypothetical protein
MIRIFGNNDKIDISELSSLRNLNTLALAGLYIIDGYPLKELIYLKRLQIEQCHFNNLSFLYSLLSLHKILRRHYFENSLFINVGLVTSKLQSKRWLATRLHFAV